MTTPSPNDLDGWNDDPLPLGWRPSAMPPFPVAALPSTIGAYVEALATATQTPLDLPGTVALGALSACAGGRVRVEPRRGWVEDTNLYVVPVLLPGSRKSAVVSACRVPLDQAQQLLVDELGGRVRDARTERDIRERYAEKLKQAAAKEGDPALIAEAQSAVAAFEQVEVPGWPRLTVDDATPEALVSALAEQGGRVAAISAEAGIFQSLTGRYTKSANLEPILKAHAGDMIQVDRRGRPPETIANPALTLIATIQPYALQEMVAREDFAGRGLLARVLWVLAPDTVGYRQIGAPPVPLDVEAAYRSTVETLAVNMAKRPGPVRLAVSEPAVKLLTEYEGRVEVMLRPNAALGAPLTRQWGSKLVGAAVRIAGCLHAVEHSLDVPVDEQTMRGALDLAEYFRAHATSALSGDDDARARDARTVLTVLVSRGMGVFKLRDLQRRMPRDLQKAEHLRAVLGDLADGGWVRENPMVGWELHPGAERFLKRADSADSADNGDETAGHDAYAHVSGAADTADSRGEVVSNVSGAADSAEAGLTRANTRRVSAVSAVSTSSCLGCGDQLDSVFAAAGETTHPMCTVPEGSAA